MLTVTKDQVQTEKLKVLFVDHNHVISHKTMETITNQVEGVSLTRKVVLDADVAAFANYIFYYVESYNRKSVHELNHVLTSVEGDNLPIILVHKNSQAKELFPYLSHQVCGMVTLSYLENNFKLIIQMIQEKGVFLEPNFHRELVFEIERKKMHDKPIKKLVLKREEVVTLLSKNEQDVLQFILDGHNNREIAELLFLAPSTISTIISHLLRKIQANDRTDAMVRAIKNGWVEAHR